MIGKTRNKIELDGWVIEQIEDYGIISDFCCGDKDLDEYFSKDALAHKLELMAENYYSYYGATGTNIKTPVALFSLSNDAIPLKIIEGRILLPKKKHYKFLPAVKIGRFGVHKNFQRKNIGTHVINMIKGLFLNDNRTGCRFIIVDAYNRDYVLNFYKKNEFDFFYNKDSERKLRSMFFDLLRLQKHIDNISPHSHT